METLDENNMSTLNEESDTSLDTHAHQCPQNEKMSRELEELKITVRQQQLTIDQQRVTLDRQQLAIDQLLYLNNQQRGEIGELRGEIGELRGEIEELRHTNQHQQRAIDDLLQANHDQRVHDENVIAELRLVIVDLRGNGVLPIPVRGRRIGNTLFLRISIY